MTAISQNPAPGSLPPAKHYPLLSDLASQASICFIPACLEAGEDSRYISNLPLNQSRDRMVF
jgi:hypothetical protein